MILLPTIKIDYSNTLMRIVLRFTEDMEWFGKQTKELGRKNKFDRNSGEKVKGKKEQFDLCFYCTLISYPLVITQSN